jgi:prolactin regulatory element-binding protein
MPRPSADKYGCPLYCVAWPPGEWAFLAGGGNLGIENKVLAVRAAAGGGGRLSEEAAKLNVGGDAPYRMACHPSGRALVLALARGGLLAVEVRPGDAPGAPPALALGNAARGARFGAAKALSFSPDGRALAVGLEDGWLEVVSWPALEPRARWRAAPEGRGLRAVDFSAPHGGGLLAAVDDGGGARLWTAAGEPVATLAPPPGLRRPAFFRVRATADARGIAFYAALQAGGAGHVARWRQDGETGALALEAASRGPVAPAPICGFDLSPDGALLAAVTPDGDQVVVSAATLRVVRRRRGAHMTFATAVAFAPDSAAVLSTASDASAALTPLRRRRGAGGGAALLALLLALLAAALGLLRALAAAPAAGGGAAAAAQLAWLPPLLRRLAPTAG